MNKPLWLIPVVLVSFLLASCCHVLRTPYALEQLNGSVGDKDQPPFPSDEERVATIVKEQLSDAYFNTDEVGKWLDGLGAQPRLLKEFISCINKSAGVNPTANSPGVCHDQLLHAIANSTGAGVWGLPTTPPDDLAVTSEAARTEIDAERFIANLTTLGATLSAMDLGLDRNDFDPIVGVKTGALRTKAYIQARTWKRGLPGQPTNALVLSGGAANGAFTAGAIWRMLSIIKGCQEAGQCGDFQIDLVVGTSTGSLIGVLVDLFFTSGQQKRALDLLIDRYTCSVESDLYCAVDEWDWELVDDVKGLVRFDGIEALLDKNLTEQSLDNQTELVVVSVRLEDGMVYAQSDQDPYDLDKGKQRHTDRVQAVLASIVEPVLAEPVNRIGPRAEHQGTFVDGGVLSVFPVLDAVNRGTERVLAFTNSTWEPRPEQSPKHAFDVLMGTLDVLVSSGITEPQLASLRALVRRWQEYKVCCDRFGGCSNEQAPSPVEESLDANDAAAAGGTESAPSASTDQPTPGETEPASNSNSPPSDAPAGPGLTPSEGRPDLESAASHPKDAVARFCTREDFAETYRTEGEAARATRARRSMAPYFPEVGSSFASKWFHLPEAALSTAVGYSFDPKVMRPLFNEGVKLFQKRCLSSLRHIGLHNSYIEKECKRDAVSVLKDLVLKPLEDCEKGVGELRLCE